MERKSGDLDDVDGSGTGGIGGRDPEEIVEGREGSGVGSGDNETTSAPSVAGLAVIRTSMSLASAIASEIASE